MLSDFERPLNERGFKDAPVMAKRLLDKKIKIDHFISSSAKRAKTTAGLFAEIYNYPTKAIELIPALYNAVPSTFFSVAEDIDDRYNSVALFSHNPGITEFVNQLSEKVNIDNMPTCGVFAVTFNSNHWKDFFDVKKNFLFFDFPKNDPAP